MHKRYGGQHTATAMRRRVDLMELSDGSSCQPAGLPTPPPYYQRQRQHQPRPPPPRRPWALLCSPGVRPATDWRMLASVSSVPATMWKLLFRWFLLLWWRLMLCPVVAASRRVDSTPLTLHGGVKRCLYTCTSLEKKRRGSCNVTCACNSDNKQQRCLDR